jgi:signal transduction histidine kinase/HAMP domain-containing protein
MTSLRNSSIKSKLRLIIMAASLVAILLVSGGFVAYEMLTFRKKMVSDLSTLADIIGNRSTAALTFDNQEDALEDLNPLRANPRITAAALYKGNNLFARYPRDLPLEAFPSPEGDGARFQKDQLLLFRKIKVHDETVGTLYLASDLKELHRRLELYGLIVLVFVLASLAVTFVLSSLLQRVITTPLFHLAQTAKSVSERKDYGVRARKGAEDEIGSLVDGFNEMLAQIQVRDAALNEANNQLEQRVQERTRDLEAEVAERTRAEVALQRQLRRIQLLNLITRATSERTDLETIFHVVLRQLEDHLAVDFGAVFLFDAENQSLTVAGARLKNPLLAPKLDLADGAMFKLKPCGLYPCRQGQAVYWADAEKQDSALAGRLQAIGVRSVVSVPLMAEKQFFGVLTVARSRPEAFELEECDFLTNLGEHVGLVGHQARLHTQLERAYNELRHSQQAVMQQERLKALGQMASGVAHDINNALSPVVGFADLLLRSETTLSPAGQKYLKYIKTAGGDIAHIVARLREFYRQREEQEALAEVDLNGVVEQVIEMNRPRWRDIPQGRGVMIEVVPELAPGLPKIASIESELREALTNLIINAIDALPNGGRIVLRTRLRSEEGTTGGRAPSLAVIEVSDNGIGMDQRTRERCLDPFFSTKGQRGTGLGLAMVYGFVDRAEGNLQIESAPGAGTTIRILLPIRKVTAADDAEGEDVSILPPLRILCVDDEPMMRELLKTTLEADGHQVEVADGGSAGIQAFRVALAHQQPFEVVITDLGMPYIDGRQVSQAVKSAAFDTPVILLTGWGAFMREDGETPPNVDAVMSKPPGSTELRRILVNLTTRSELEALSASGA